MLLWRLWWRRRTWIGRMCGNLLCSGWRARRCATQTRRCGVCCAALARRAARRHCRPAHARRGRRHLLWLSTTHTCVLRSFHRPQAGEAATEANTFHALLLPPDGVPKGYSRAPGDNYWPGRQQTNFSIAAYGLGGAGRSSLQQPSAVCALASALHLVDSRLYAHSSAASPLIAALAALGAWPPMLVALNKLLSARGSLSETECAALLAGFTQLAWALGYPPAPSAAVADAHGHPRGRDPSQAAAGAPLVLRRAAEVACAMAVAAPGGAVPSPLLAVQLSHEVPSLIHASALFLRTYARTPHCE